MVYVDDAAVRKYGYVWFHLLADNIHELHIFAAQIGVNMRAFHRGARYPHYDITQLQRNRALRNGARAVPTREAVLIGKRTAQTVAGVDPRCHQLTLSLEG